MSKSFENDSAEYSSLILKELTYDREKDVVMLQELRKRNLGNGNLVRMIDRWLLMFLAGDEKEEFAGRLYCEIKESHSEGIKIISKGLRKVVNEKDISDNPLGICSGTYGKDRIYVTHTDRRVVLLFDNPHSEFLNFSIDYFRSEPHGFQFSDDKGDKTCMCHWEKERVGRFRTTPDEIDYLFTFGSALMGHGLYSYAVTRFEEALKSDPDDHEAVLRLSDCFISMGYHEPAIHYLKRAASIKPDDARAYVELAECYKELGLYWMALENLLRAQKSGYEDKMIHNNIGVVYFQLEDYSQSIEAFKKALGFDPNATHPWRNIGLAYEKVRQFDKAIEAYEKYSELDPQNHDPYLLMGEVYEETGNLSDATQAYQRAVEIRPDYAAYLNLAMAYEKMNRISDARRSYQEALRIYPEGKEARAELFRFDHPDMEDLEQEMAQVVKEHPFLEDDPEAVPVIYEEAKRRKAEREGRDPAAKQGEESLRFN